MNRSDLQILMNYCEAVADAMAFTLMRTAYSAFVKETEDFSCQLVTPEGQAFASPRSFGAPWYSGIDYGPVLRLIDDYQEGDICITNDPYSGSVATHTPDLHIWKPVYRAGRIACFVVGHIHNTDMGGAVPATLSRTLSEVMQEGLRIPPAKLVRAGQLNEELVAIMRSNVRAPEQNWGDLQAQIASVNIGERRMHEVIDRFGLEAFSAGMHDILDYAEEQAREVIRSIPDGEYAFADFADEDEDGGLPCRVALTLRVRGDEVQLDYTGSDPQLASALNMPTGGHERHPLVHVGLTYVLSTLRPGLLLNAGTLRLARAVLPEGSIVNCVYPAAVGMRSLTCMVSQVATFGAFSLALPDRIPASTPGGIAIINVKTSDSAGRSIMASLGPVGGGGGGTPVSDGPDGLGGASAFLKNTPLEISEAEVPILFRAYGLVPDSGGAGRFRGGLATRMEFEVLNPNTTVTARNRDRSIFASWGVLGGAAGALSRFTRNPGRPEALELGNKDVVQAGPGDVISVIGPGAGGYGDPYRREPEAVATDVACGFVSKAAARNQYGVVLSEEGALDPDKTLRLRAAPRERTDAHFDLGAARSRFEAVWTRERYQALTEFLWELPVGWRQFIKRQVFTAVAAGRHADGDVSSQMRAIRADILASYPVLANTRC